MNSSVADKLKNLTTKSGVYVMHSSSGAVIYVGKAKNLKNRVSQYFNNSPKPAKVMAMVEKVADFEYFVTLSERDAFALESNLIKKYKPFYNILLKDDKAFPYIKINLKQDFPNFEVVRRLTKKDGNRFFGPYISGISPYALIKAINLAYPLRTCKNFSQVKATNRACLNFSLGLCSAPCTNQISKQDYRAIVNKAMDFLSGNDDEIEKILNKKMQIAVECENFEKAIEIRDILKMIGILKQKTVALLPKDFECDCFAYKSDGTLGVVCVLTLRHGKVLGVKNYVLFDASLTENETLAQFVIQYYSRHSVPKVVLTNISVEEYDIETYLKEEGKALEISCPVKATKKQLVKMAEENAYEYLTKHADKQEKEFSKTIGALENLKQKLNLKKLPNRIECYDISNISGTNKVASMTVCTAGRPNRSHYRKFIIKNVDGQNDFECLKETLTRRIKELSGKDPSFSVCPDLMVIDGGKGQLSSCLEVVKKFGKDIEMISLAEKFDEVFVPNSSVPIMLKRGSSELRILQNIRDEAHRFAITFHRQRRTKQMLKSPLDEIKGLGKVKKQALYNQFGTLEQIKMASVDELNLVKGIDIVLAQKIYNFFHKAP